eukprot:gene3000-1982_t
MWWFGMCLHCDVLLVLCDVVVVCDFTFDSLGVVHLMLSRGCFGGILVIDYFKTWRAGDIGYNVIVSALLEVVFGVMFVNFIMRLVSNYMQLRSACVLKRVDFGHYYIRNTVGNVLCSRLVVL